VRETQLRAFHSTTAEISPLFQKMQQQLVTMMSVSALAPEDEQQDTRSGGELGLDSKGTLSPPRRLEQAQRAEEHAEEADLASGNSPLRRDEEMAEAFGGEEKDVNMTQLEYEEEDLYLSTAPVRKTTPRKTPRQILKGLSPAQRGSASKTPGLAAGLASPGGVSRALLFEGGVEKGVIVPGRLQQGEKEAGKLEERGEEAKKWAVLPEGIEQGGNGGGKLEGGGEKGDKEEGVFVKPADRAPSQAMAERIVPETLAPVDEEMEGEEKEGSLERNGNDEGKEADQRANGGEKEQGGGERNGNLEMNKDDEGREQEQAEGAGQGGENDKAHGGRSGGDCGEGCGEDKAAEVENERDEEIGQVEGGGFLGGAEGSKKDEGGAFAGEETLLMEDDVIGTVPATYAGETLLMEEPEMGSLEGGLGTSKSAPLAGIPEEGEIQDEAAGEEDGVGSKGDQEEFTQVDDEGGSGEDERNPPEEEADAGGGTEEGEEEPPSEEKEVGTQTNEQAEGGSDAQPEQTPRKRSRGAALGKDMENGQRPESVQMSEFPDETLKAGSELPDGFQLAGRRVSFGDPLRGGDLTPQSGGRRESLLQKMDLIMDVDFTEAQGTEKGVQPSPNRQGSTQPNSNCQRATQPSPTTRLSPPKSGEGSGLMGGGFYSSRKEAGRRSGSVSFRTGFDLNETAPADLPASAPPGPRPTAGGASPTAVRTLFRRKSSGLPGEMEPDAKRFKGASVRDDEVVQDSGSGRALDGTPLKSESVGRKRGGSSEEKDADEDPSKGDSGEDNDDEPPSPPRLGVRVPKDLVSSQRSVSGKGFEGLPSPASISVGSRARIGRGSGPVERNVVGTGLANEHNHGVEQGPLAGVDTQATGNDLAADPEGASEQPDGAASGFRGGEDQLGVLGPGSAPLPSSLAALQCSEALTSANPSATFRTEGSPVEMTPAAMPQPTRPPPAPKARTPRRVERTGQGRFDPDAMAGLDEMLDIMRPSGNGCESLQSDGRVGDSEFETEDEDLMEDDGSDLEEGLEEEANGVPVGTEPLSDGRGLLRGGEVPVLANGMADGSQSEHHQAGAGLDNGGFQHRSQPSSHSPALSA
jgi:hypothetical protein